MTTTSSKTLKLVYAALMAAFTCIATMAIQIPSPTSGYVHLGDGLVFLSGILLGPIYGCAAAGIGSMFADLLTGYPQYAIATLLIKGCAAFLVGFLYTKINDTFHIPTKKTAISILTAGVLGSLIIIGGYFLFDSFLLGNPFAAIPSIAGNVFQSFIGIIVAILLSAYKRTQ